MATRDIFDKCVGFTRHLRAKEMGVYPFFRPLVSSEGSRVVIEGSARIMLGSNNYLGLTHHPRVVQAAKKAIDDFGTGCTGSRMLNGTLELHEQLEAELAEFLGKEAVLLWSTGFMSNSGSVGTLCTRKDIIFADREDHASLIDGFILSGARLVRFKHNNVADLERKLIANEDAQGKLVAIDGVYSMTGELAPVDKVVALAKKHGARVLVDEAHGIGPVGPGGRGSVALFGVTEDVDLISGTFSKTFASMGGFLACPQSVKDYLMHHSRQLMYTASFTPSVVATVLECLHILQEEPELVEQVRANASWMRSELQGMGFNCLDSETAVVPIVIGGVEQMLWFNRRIFEEGIFANPVLPPAVPTKACLIRTSYMATHERRDLQEALDIFERVGNEVGVIGPNKEAMAEHWAQMAEQAAI
ncbi:MAG: pyridoxal phosphate-dependent aminotransferase family protein [Myxococcota bacterium]|jgi:8-amino-7-oxononanoate synthase|nr:pyridoxal phosphate-dependent aminotransferase family protein [Myxococcota bacterium]